MVGHGIDGVCLGGEEQKKESSYLLPFPPAGKIPKTCAEWLPGFELQ